MGTEAGLLYGYVLTPYLHMAEGSLRILEVLRVPSVLLRMGDMAPSGLKRLT